MRASPPRVVILPSIISQVSSAKEVAAKVEKHSVKAIVRHGVFPTANRN